MIIISQLCGLSGLGWGVPLDISHVVAEWVESAVI